MAEDNRSLNSAEKNNETSWYKSFGAGLASGIIKIPEGLKGLAPYYGNHESPACRDR